MSNVHQPMRASMIVPQPTSVNRRSFGTCDTSSNCINDAFFRCNSNGKCVVRSEYRELVVSPKSSNTYSKSLSYSDFLAYTSQAQVRDVHPGVATPTLKLLSWQQIMVKNVSVPGNCTLTTPLLGTSTEGLTPERCLTTES